MRLKKAKTPRRSSHRKQGSVKRAMSKRRGSSRVSVRRGGRSSRSAKRSKSSRRSIRGGGRKANIALGTGIAAVGGTYAAVYFQLNKFFSWYQEWFKKANKCDDLHILITNELMNAKVKTECNALIEKTVEQNKWFFIEILRNTKSTTKPEIILSLKDKINELAAAAAAAAAADAVLKIQTLVRKNTARMELKKDGETHKGAADVAAQVAADKTDANRGEVVPEAESRGKGNAEGNAEGNAQINGLDGGANNLSTEKQILYMCILILYLQKAPN